MGPFTTLKKHDKYTVCIQFIPVFLVIVSTLKMLPYWQTYVSVVLDPQSCKKNTVPDSLTSSHIFIF